MAVKSGRDSYIQKNNVTIGGLQTTSISLDGSPVDVTNVGSNGFRTLASFSGSKSLTVTGNGVWDVGTLTDIGFNPSGALLLTDIKLIDGDNQAITGNFFMSNYTEDAPHDGAITFSVTLESSGTWTRV